MNLIVGPNRAHADMTPEGHGRYEDYELRVHQEAGEWRLHLSAERGSLGCALDSPAALQRILRCLECHEMCEVEVGRVAGLRVLLVNEPSAHHSRIYLQTSNLFDMLTMDLDDDETTRLCEVVRTVYRQLRDHAG